MIARQEISRGHFRRKVFLGVTREGLYSFCSANGAATEALAL